MNIVISSGRRDFVAGAMPAAIAVVAFSPPCAQAPAGAADLPAAARGYRITEHIEKYYKTTEV